jgi:hypothetical protein
MFDRLLAEFDPDLEPLLDEEMYQHFLQVGVGFQGPGGEGVGPRKGSRSVLGVLVLVWCWVGQGQQFSSPSCVGSPRVRNSQVGTSLALSSRPCVHRQSVAAC